MSDGDLIGLAEEAGIAPNWRDAFGKMHDVSPDSLRSVLKATGIAAGSDAEICDAREALRRQAAEAPPPLFTADVGREIVLPVAPGRFRLRTEDGATHDGIAQERNGRAVLPAIDAPGYHRLEMGGVEATIAVAPSRCFQLADAAPGRRLWALAVQLYSLRRDGDGGIGDFAALRRFVQAAGRRGAAAVAISPVHAQFTADPDRFSPYAPSSRIALNVLHADAEDLLGAGWLPEDAAGRTTRTRLEALDLIDWPAAARARIAYFREVFQAFRGGAGPQDEFAAFRQARASDILPHARFEALHAHIFGQDRGRWHWRDWPEQFRDPNSPAVEAFARDNAEEVEFHLFLQFLAERSLAAAQQAARDAGMPVGLISDLAVGTDGGGSHAWSRQGETLIGLTVGAPPDLLSPDGQSWGLAAFSPRGLVQHGFGAFIEMIRAALRHAGGVRIDHAMGIARLWVLPDGASPKDGAYLRFPVDDLMRLIALESQRHRAIVLGEDLGTLPDGFQERLDQRGIMGMRVLWFEQDEGRFRPPSTWSPGAAAMTSTHDLPTVAGWWSGTDLGWRQRLHLMGDAQAEHDAFEARGRDRAALWEAMRASGAAEGERPEPDITGPVVDAAARHVARAACNLLILPVEDALGQRDQPNLPGTLHEHPNWQRRTPGPAEQLLDAPDVAARLSAVNEIRSA